MKRKPIVYISVILVAIIAILVLTGSALKIRGATDVIPTSSASCVIINKYNDGNKSIEEAYYYDSEAISLLKDIFRGKYVTDNATTVESISLDDSDNYYHITVNTVGELESLKSSEAAEIYIDSRTGEYKIYVGKYSYSPFPPGTYSYSFVTENTYVSVNGIALDTDKIDRYFSEGVTRNVAAAKDGELYGIISYVAPYSKNTEDPSACKYYIGVQPLGVVDEETWVPFVVTAKTKTSFDFSSDISDMPLLSVGNRVKVTYSGTELDGRKLYTEFFAESIESANVGKIYSQNNPMEISSSYVFDPKEVVGVRDYGTVIHVARMKAGAKGYLVYLDYHGLGEGNLSCFWIDDNSDISKEALKMFSSGTPGYTINIEGFATNRPENGLYIEAVASVSLEIPKAEADITIGDIIKQSDISKIALLWYPLSSNKNASIYEGRVKDMLFTLLLKDKRIIDDEERFFALENSFADDFENITFIWLILNPEEELSIKVNKKTGEFTIIYTQIKGDDAFPTPLYASAEGERINAGILRWL